MGIEIAKDPADITKVWSDGGRIITFHAWQVPVTEEGYDPEMTTVKFDIEIDGKKVHEAVVPWMNFKGEPFLALQVYTLSQKPNYPHPEYQVLMEDFAVKCKYFEKPPQIFWEKGPQT